MNVLNNSNDDVVECPLCMEPLEVDDLNFYPCTCGYQICRFCWHRIRTDENELCPACRKAYPENPADFTPLSQEQISALKAEKRQRDQQRKQKITENRKHLANVRVVQKNLVFVVGLPPRLADPEILKRHEYFGKYGKIHKVVINPSTTYAGVQGPSASAYVTYLQNNDSLRAIQAVNNIMIDGRLIKTSLGTTKYCSHFMKNQQCPKPDCMYLHELGDPEASFTKEEMHQGKHQEYEKRLHDALIALTQQQSSSTTPPPPTVNGTSDNLGIGVVVGSPSTNKITETSNSKMSPTSNGTSNGPIQSKEAWPSLSTSPVNKENKINNKTNNSNSGSGGGGKENTIKNSENRKHEKTKNKDSKGNKNKQNQQNNNSNNSNSNSNKEQNNRQENILTEKNKQNNNSLIINNITDDDSNSLPEFENDDLSNDGKADTPSLSSTSSSSNNGDSGTVSESASGKSSPGTFHDNQNVIKSSLSTSSSSSNSSTSSSSHLQQVEQHNKTNLEKSAHFGTSDTSNTLFSGTTDIKNNSNIIDTSSRFSKLSLFDDNNSFFSTNTFQPYFKNDGTINSNPSHLPDLLNGTAESDETSLEREQRDAKLLLKGLSGFHHLNNDNSSEDWEAAFKYVMMRNSNNKQLEEQQHDEMLRVQELHKQRNLVNSLNGMPSQQHLQLNNFNGMDYTNSTDYLHNLSDLNRLSQLQQQQQRLHNSIHSVQENGHIFPGNMSKFFDFHKNQQNQIIHNGLSNSPQQQISDQLNMANLLENSRLNSHYFDQSQANSMIGQQQQLQQQKQRILPNKYDQIGSHNLLMNNNTTNQQQKRLQQPPVQHPHYMPIDDDLGFDPFIETQKALAELMENENMQQQTQINHNKLLDQSRPRMPPPGFNHMNAFGFGVPRAGSKILPFMNMNANTPPQQQQPQQNNWSQHMNYQQQQQNQSNDPHNHQSQNNQHKGFGSMTDWTTLDPAIVSYRQFPSFMSGPPMQSQQQPQQQQQHNAADMFMPQLNQQNQGFGNHHGINLQNSIMNQQQQNSPAQVNYSHTNWLNTNLDQNNMYMNNLTNGFTNNFDKFSIPMPPGFQNNVGSKPQQKTECIN